MNRRVVATLLVATMLAAALVANPPHASAAPGDLDISFGEAGFVTHSSPLGIFTPIDHAIVQPDGKILIAGTDGPAGRRTAVVGRLNIDGSPDTAFGGEGVRSVDLGGSDDELASMALQDDGKILLAGNSSVDGGRLTTLVRLTADGSLDETFGKGSGRVEHDLLDTGTSLGGQVALGGRDADTGEQTIYLAGWAEDTNRFAVTRMLADGTTDTSFGHADVPGFRTGTAFVDFGARAVTQDIAIAGQRILLSGHIRNGEPLDFGRDSDDAGIARLLLDGTLDATLDGDGRFTWDGSGSNVDDHAQSIVPLEDGSIAVSGNRYFYADGVLAGTDAVISRVLAGGGLDKSFGAAGTFLPSFGAKGDTLAGGITVDDAGRWVVAGRHDLLENRFAVTRLDPTVNPPLDTSFSGDGAAAVTCDGEGGATGVAVQPDDGKIVALGSCRSEIALARFEGLPGVPPLSELSLTVDTASTDVGVSAVDLSTIDLGSLPLFESEHETTGPQASPWGASPWGASPWGASPWGASPWGASPWGASPTRPPVRSIPLYQTFLASLPDTPLSAVPLRDGWSSKLVGTKFEGLPDQSILLDDVLALAPANTAVAGVTINDVSVASIPALQRVTLQGFLFAGPSLDELSATADWCGALLARGFDCAAQGIDEATSTLADLDMAGAPVTRLTFVPHLRVADAELAKSMAAAFDIFNVDVTRNSLGEIPTDQLPAGIATCPPIDCPTLADAVIAGQIADAETARLGVLLERDALVGELTFTELLQGLVNPRVLPVNRVDIDALAASTPVTPPYLRYTASAVVSCAVDNLGMTVLLPEGFRYVPESSTRADGDGQPARIDDPSTGGGFDGDSTTTEKFTTQVVAAPSNRLTWSLEAPFCGEFDTAQTIHVAFDAQPGIELGTKTSSLHVFADSASESLLNAAPVAVGEAFEPNDDTASATPVVPGVLYLSHISSGTDVDKFKLAPQPDGTRVVFQLGHQPDDFDLQLSGPTAPLLGDGTTPLRTQPLEDPGLTRALTGETIAPDTLEDVSLADDAVSHSALAGVQDDTALLVVPPGGEETPIVATVTSHLATASHRPYSLRVITASAPDLKCPKVAPSVGAGVAGTLPNMNRLDPETRTLFVWNQQRFGELHGTAAAESVRAAIEGANGLATFGDVEGLLLPVEGDAQTAAAYDTWRTSQCDVGAANEVAANVSRVIRDYAAQLPQLRFVTIIGDDNVVPFLRVPDGVTLANQIEYYPDVVFDEADNPISAAFAFGYMLTDNVYLDREPSAWLNHELFTPDFAGGRIVETDEEILAAIAQYRAKPYVELHDVLVSGYDFLNDLVADLDTTFTAAGRNVRTLEGELWKREHLVDELNRAPDLAAVNGHFNHSGALTAAGNTADNPAGEVLEADDLRDTTFPPGAVMFSVGCNSGLNVPAASWIGATEEQALQLMDWAQAQRGSFVGNTGFGYGDTELLAGSELLHSLMAKRLDGTMALGQAFTLAREDLLEAVPIPGVVDEKVYSVATFYGFPFIKVGANGAIADPPDAITPAGAAAASSLESDAATGLPTAQFDVSESLATTEVPTQRGTYHKIEGETPLLAHFRPVQPTKTVTLPEAPAGYGIGDVLVTGLSSGPDQADVNGVFYTPTIDNSQIEPEVLVTDVAFPAALATVTPEQRVKLFVGQYESNLDRPGFGSQRLFTRMAGKAFFVPEGTPVDRPTFTEIEATTLDTVTAFRVETDADKVLVLYKRPGVVEWGKVTLTNTNGVWTGGVAHADVVDYVVQAVRDGWVGTSRGKGRDHQPRPLPASQGLEIQLTGEAGQNGWFTQPVTATVVDGSDGALYEASVNGSTFQLLPKDATTSIASVGLNKIAIRGSDGSQGQAYAPVDTMKPTVTFANLAEGQVITPGKKVTVDFTCADTGSGVATCGTSDPNPIDTSPGTHTFTVHAKDLAGHETTATVTYRAGYTFEGFFDPVKNPDGVNVVNAGRNVPVKFRLRNGEDQVVSDVTAVTEIASTTMACRSSGESNIVISTELGSTSRLKFDEDAQRFHYNWKTEKTYRDSCRKFTVTFIDGVKRSALFRFT